MDTRPSPADLNSPPLADEHLGLEARSKDSDHLDLRIWLRLLACSTQIEQVIRQQLRVKFASTLPRFDYLAQLERHPNGLRMNVLSRYLMVTGGNVTALTDQLVRDGLVERVDDPDDRRSYLVRLTPAGQADFSAMAAEHEQWLVSLLGGMSPDRKEELFALLGELRLHLLRHQGLPS